MTKSINRSTNESTQPGHKADPANPADLAKIYSAQNKALKYLVAQRQEGWWPYFPGKAASHEATAWCAIALKDDLLTAQKTIPYLLANQNNDGGWSTAPNLLPSDWVSGPVVLALRTLDLAGSGSNKSGTLVPASALKRAYRYLDDSVSERYLTTARIIIPGVDGPQAIT